MKKQPYHQPLLTRHVLRKPLATKLAAECALLVWSETRAAEVELTINRIGTNLIVSWPASAGAWTLELSPSLTNKWRAAWNNLGVTNNGRVSVLLRVVQKPYYFRLKAKDPSEKDPFADKDPSEKDPASDKSAEKGDDEKCPDLEYSPCW